MGMTTDAGPFSAGDPVSVVACWLREEHTWAIGSRVEEKLPPFLDEVQRALPAAYAGNSPFDRDILCPPLGG